MLSNRPLTLTVVALLVLAAGVGLWGAWVLTPVVDAQTETDLEQYGTVVTVTNVVDGDTVDIDPTIDGVGRVRFIGVDTPEVSGRQEPGGPEASAFTTEQLEGEQVALEFDEERLDRFGRLLAYVWLPGGELFNETLVREGYAEVATFPPNTKYEARFLAAQEGTVQPPPAPTTQPKNKDRAKKVDRKTIPKRRLPPTDGIPTSYIVYGFVLGGASLLALGLVRRGR